MNSKQHAEAILENILLASYSTIGLGGPARFFLVGTSPEMLQDGLRFAREKNIPTQVLGGGSNIIFPDEGYRGLIIQIGMKGITFQHDGDSMLVTGAAGEPWDQFVLTCLKRGLSGIECLSGIPGCVGATPIQNVGAYGQEVADTIVSVRALHRQSLKLVEIASAECRFGYRQSRFKTDDNDQYIILDVTFRLRKNGRPAIRYPELQKFIDTSGGLDRLDSGTPVLLAVREAVLALRRQKSMVLDPQDSNSRSVGSFFTNPILAQHSFESLIERWEKSGDGNPIPSFASSQGIKVPAAWLVEKTGFHRGYRYRGVGISQNHSLALVNYNGTTKELLDLASMIESKVYERFSIRLEREPVVVL